MNEFTAQLNQHQAHILSKQLIDPPLVSIVVPIFNASDCLDCCVASLVHQTYPASLLEIILVDDGSTDDSGFICDNYSHKYSNVRVIHREQSSGGCSVPRNIGVSSSKGDWILFVDADDWLGSESVSRLVRHATDWNSDYIFGRTIYTNHSKLRGFTPAMTGTVQSLADVDTDNNYDFFEMCNALSRMVKKQILIENSIEFQNVYPEDISWNIRVLNHCQIVSMAMDYEYYFYRRDKGRQTIATGKFIPSEWKSPSRQIAGIKAALDAYSEYERVEPSFPILKKIFEFTICNNVKRIIDWADYYANDYPDEGVSTAKKAVDLFAPYLSKDLLERMELDKALAIELMLQNNFRWWDNSLTLSVSYLNKIAQSSISERNALSRLNLHPKPNLAHISQSTISRLYALQAYAVNAQIDSICLSESTDNLITLSGTITWPFYCTDDLCAVITMGNDCALATSFDEIEESFGGEWQKRTRWNFSVNVDLLPDSFTLKTISLIVLSNDTIIRETGVGSCLNNVHVSQIQCSNRNIYIYQKKNRASVSIYSNTISNKYLEKEKLIFSQSAIEKVRAKLDFEEKQSAELRHKIAKLNERIDRIEKSTSWKLLKKLRRLKTWIFGK